MSSSMYSLICAIHPEFKPEWGGGLYNDRIHIKF